MAEKTLSLKKATTINACGKYATIIVQLIVNAVLSRILSPGDYGIVAIITVFSTFFLTLSDMGFSTAIVQCKDLTKKEVNNIFSFTIIIGVILVGMFSIISLGVSIFYEDKIYLKLGLMLNISLFLNTLNMVPNGIVNREKQFVSIAFRTVTACVLASIVAIIAAFCGWRYYAIVFQTILTSCIIFGWNCIKSKPKVDFNGCTSSVKKVLDYSGFQFAFNVVNYFSRNLDNLLTGKFFGNVELGYYNKAYTLMLYPVNNLAGVVTPVIHPILSDYQADTEKIYRNYIKLEKFLFIVAAFVAPACYLASAELITIMFGKNWEASIKCFELLSFAVLPQFVGSPAGAIYQSLGKTRLLFYNALINTAITVSAIFVGVFMGGNIVILSLCVSVAYCIHFFTTNLMLIQMGFNRSFISFLLDIKSELIFMSVVYVSTIFYPLSNENVFISFVEKGVYITFCYSVLLLITREHKIIKEIIKHS